MHWPLFLNTAALAGPERLFLFVEQAASINLGTLRGVPCQAAAQLPSEGVTGTCRGMVGAEEGDGRSRRALRAIKHHHVDKEICFPGQYLPVCAGTLLHLNTSACSALIRSLCTCAKQPSSRWCAGRQELRAAGHVGIRRPSGDGQVSRIGLFLLEHSRWSNGRVGPGRPFQINGRAPISAIRPFLHTAPPVFVALPMPMAFFTHSGQGEMRPQPGLVSAARRGGWAVPRLRKLLKWACPRCPSTRTFPARIADCPVPAPADTATAALAAGSMHTCAQLLSGSLVCWGDNNYGQLGTGDKTMRLSATGVSLGGGACQFLLFLSWNRCSALFGNRFCFN